MNSSARTVLFAVAVIAGLAEIGMAIQFALERSADSQPAPAAIFGVAFLTLAWFVRSGKFWPVIPLIVLFTVELAFMPMYSRGSWIDWAEQAGFAVVSVVGLIASVALIVSRKRVVA